jgi:hypothetical protein
MSRINKCRSCNSKRLKNLFTLGVQYFTGIFPKNKNEKLPKGELQLIMCQACCLVQLSRNFNLKKMYGKTYGYRTGLNASMVNHIKNKTNYLKKKANIKENDLIIDIGSNDGTTLGFFNKNKKLKLIGVDPTIAKFRKFYDKNIIAIDKFFTYAKIKRYLGNDRAKIITTISMFYDLPNPVQFAKDIYSSLNDQGIWHLEQSYSGLMLKNNSYDTICHEHLEYYSLKSIKNIFEKCNFKIIDIQFNDINGGSFAISVAKKSSHYKESIKLIKNIEKQENKNKINTIKSYKDFFKKIKIEKKKLIKFLKEAKKNNKTVVGYGASTKGNVILQYSGINSLILTNICDVNVEKNGSYTPGSKIKIISEDIAKKNIPDYFLVLPWHFKKFILGKEKKLITKGVNFVFPLPKFAIN